MLKTQLPVTMALLLLSLLLVSTFLGKEFYLYHFISVLSSYFAFLERFSDGTKATTTKNWCCILLFLGTDQVTDFTLQNRCTETLWPNVLDTGGTTGPASLGFEGVEANSLGPKNVLKFCIFFPYNLIFLSYCRHWISRAKQFTEIYE